MPIVNARDISEEAAQICAEDAALGYATWRLDLAYEGTAYRGWARQPGQRTIEGLVMEVLETVLREPVRRSRRSSVRGATCAPSGCSSRSTRCCRPTSP
jgi:hypothetical protein